MRSARRKSRTADGQERWPIPRLATELRRHADGGDVAPELADALRTLKQAGAKRYCWARSTLYAVEGAGNPAMPTMSWELVMLYDLLFNNGEGYLTRYWEQVRVADPPKAVPAGRRSRTNALYPGDHTVFVCDVTVPDGIEMPLNFHFYKTWRLLNAGSVVWDNRRLMRVGPVSAFGVVRSKPFEPVPRTAPGELVDVTVEVWASSTETTHTESRWKMVDDNGMPCFPHLPYGVGMIIAVADGAPEPDLSIPAAAIERATARKLAEYRNSTSTGGV